MKIDNTFYIDCLQKASDNFLSSQVQESEFLIKINSELEYTVKKILSSHVHNEVLQYKIYWSRCNSDN